MLPKKVRLHPPTKECLLCRGTCCKRLPGPYHPSDFPKPITTTSLLKILQSGRAVVDWWERPGSPGYFLRPPNTSDNGQFFHGSWGGACKLLTKEGCPLPFEARPLGCKSLKPREDSNGHCTTDYDKYEAFRSWSKYQKVIKKVEKLANAQ